MNARAPVRIAMVAGGMSDDTMCADLVEALSEALPGARFLGIGGPRMQAVGLEPWYPGDTLAVRLKKQEVQDWVVVLIFNHLMAGAEAFVSAELWDFPVTLQARALPQNRLGLGAALYWGK